MPTKEYTIPLLNGMTTKPLAVSALGTITFVTDVLIGDEMTEVEITPNQAQCEAYGYTYNRATGTCSVFRYNTNLISSFKTN